MIYESRCKSTNKNPHFQTIGKICFTVGLAEGERNGILWLLISPIVPMTMCPFNEIESVGEGKMRVVFEGIMQSLLTTTCSNHFSSTMVAASSRYAHASTTKHSNTIT